MGIRATRNIGRKTAYAGNTSLEKYTITLVDRFDAPNTPDAAFSIRSTTFQEAIRTGAYTGNPTRYPSPFHTFVDSSPWVVTKVTFTYGIREGGGLSKNDEVFQVRCSAGSETFTKNLFTIPFDSAPCPPGETRSYTYSFPIAFNRADGINLNTGFQIASSSAGIYEYSYEQLDVVMYAVNPRPQF